MSFKEKSQITLIVLVILLSSTVSFSIFVHGEDLPDYFVAGFVFINEEKTDGVEVIVSVPGYENRSNISHYDADYDLHGLYKIGFYAKQGQYANFTVKINDKYYIPTPNSFYIDKPHPYFYFNINLTVIIENHPPCKPINPSPINKAVDVPTTTSLSVDVYDPDGENMNIYFYWGNGTMIGVDTDVPSSGTASIGPLSLTCNKLYSWYVIANDSALQNTSDTWSFTTQSCSPVNHPPDKPVDPVPENNSENIRLNPQLSVYVTDPDDDSLSVSFYNAENNELIDKIDNVENATRATVTWPGLSFNTNYSWYVVVNDSEFETYSDIFSFKTIEEDNTPPSVFFETPEKGSLYILGNKITLPGLIKTTFILGNLTIAVNATDNQSGINRVELTIKSKWCHEITENLTESPYTYKWNRLGFGLYNLTATVYDLAGNSANTSIVVRKFL